MNIHKLYTKTICLIAHFTRVILPSLLSYGWWFFCNPSFPLRYFSFCLYRRKFLTNWFSLPPVDVLASVSWVVFVVVGSCIFRETRLALAKRFLATLVPEALIVRWRINISTNHFILIEERNIHVYVCMWFSCIYLCAA